MSNSSQAEMSEFIGKIIANGLLRYNRPIEPAQKQVYTNKELKHFKYCKKSICDECRTILSKIEVNGDK